MHARVKPERGGPLGLPGGIVWAPRLTETTYYVLERHRSETYLGRL